MSNLQSPATPADGPTSKHRQLWRAFQMRRTERLERRKLAEDLRELNSAQLRDIGFAREVSPEMAVPRKATERPQDQVQRIDMAY